MDEKKKPSDRIHESLVTYEIYASMPDDGNRYEVADGRLELMSPAPTLVHQTVSSELFFRLQRDCRHEYIIIAAPVDVILSETEVRQPDLVLIRRSRTDILSKRGVNGAPDLVVEITSEFSRRRDKVHKTKAYAKYGVPEYWIVDLTNFTLEQYILHETGHYELSDVYSEDELIRSDKIACASFSMRELMQELPEIRDE